jgi:hypothetical protein
LLSVDSAKTPVERAHLLRQLQVEIESVEDATNSPFAVSSNSTSRAGAANVGASACCSIRAVTRRFSVEWN